MSSSIASNSQPSTPRGAAGLPLRAGMLVQHQRLLRDRGTAEERAGETVPSAPDGSAADVHSISSHNTLLSNQAHLRSTRRNSVGSASASPIPDGMGLSEFEVEDLEAGRSRGVLQGSFWVIPHRLLVGPFPMWNRLDEVRTRTAPAPSTNMPQAGGLTAPGTTGSASFLSTIAKSERDEALEVLRDVARVSVFLSLVDTAVAAQYKSLHDYRDVVEHPPAPTKKTASTTHSPLALDEPKRRKSQPSKALKGQFLWIPLPPNANHDDDYIAAFALDIMERILTRGERVYLHCTNGVGRALGMAILLVSVLLRKDKVAATSYVLRCKAAAEGRPLGSLETVGRVGEDATSASYGEEDSDSAGDGTIAQATTVRALFSSSVLSGEIPNLVLGLSSPISGGVGAGTSYMTNVLDQMVKLWRLQIFRLIDNASTHFGPLMTLLEEEAPPSAPPAD